MSLLLQVKKLTLNLYLTVSNPFLGHEAIKIDAINSLFPLVSESNMTFILNDNILGGSNCFLYICILDWISQYKYSANGKSVLRSNLLYKLFDESVNWEQISNGKLTETCIVLEILQKLICVVCSDSKTI